MKKDIYADSPTDNGTRHREFTQETRYIICMWDIRGISPKETARLLTRDEAVVNKTIEDAKNDGYYDAIKKFLSQYDRYERYLRAHLPIRR